LTGEALAQRAAPLGQRRDAEGIYAAASRRAPDAFDGDGSRSLPVHTVWSSKNADS